MLRIVGVAGADMAERIDDALVGQDAIGGHQFFENEIELAHCAPLPCRGAILWAAMGFVNRRSQDLRTGRLCAGPPCTGAAVRRGTTPPICAMPSRYRAGIWEPKPC